MMGKKSISYVILSTLFSVYIGSFLIILGSFIYGSIVITIAYKFNDMKSNIPNNSEGMAKAISKVHSIMDLSFIIAALIVLLFLIICSILFYKSNKSYIKYGKFINNIRGFFSKILLSLISLFSITYGLIGNDIESASNGIMISVVIVSVSLLAFGIMIIEHLKMLSYNESYFYNKSEYIRNNIKEYENKNNGNKPLIMP